MRALQLIGVLLVIVLVCGCKEVSTQPDPVDHEMITTYEMMLIQNQQPRDTITVVWQDVDGPGGDAPNRIDTLHLDSGRTYYATVRILNDSKTPPENLTPTINEEEGNHQFFYAFIPANIGTTTILDKDANDKPVGLSLDVTALQSGTGVLTVMLSHYPNSLDKDGVTPSDETDLSIEIPVFINP